MPDAHPDPQPDPQRPMSAADAPAALDPRDAELARALVAGERRALARAITLTESTRSDHRARADALLNAILPHAGRAVRVGISGVPGVGKSTFVEALGLRLVRRGLRVAVLAIDPSSVVSGGSILGDKTRMEQLAVAEGAFIRPSPASGTLGGVAAKTREAMLLCEAAGHDVVIVETVGVGQSETAVADMTDIVVLLQLPNAGDELQAIKKGVMEIASLVVINKADTDPEAATRAQAQITSAFRMLGLGPARERADARVLKVSALGGDGIDDVWTEVERWVAERRASGEFDARRQRQSIAWMWDLVQSRLLAGFRGHPAVRAALPDMLERVSEGRLAATVAARALLDLHAGDPIGPR
jgi:LAO/AO transport system kinase